MGKQIKLGILGLGTVGTGTVEVLTENSNSLADKTGTELIVEQILVSNKQKHSTRQFNACDIQTKLTEDPWEIIYNDEIDIVVELIGGEEPTYTYIKNALTTGKHVVTANKELIAKYGKQLSSLANNSNVNLLYEASVAGGIPVIRPIKSCLAGNQITKIQGILNGTTNFILSEMEQTGAEFNQMLTKAQELGYAESDPIDDIGGFDAVRKLAIITSLCTGTEILPDNIYTEGIEKISEQDIKFLNNYGYTIKLLGQTKIEDSTITSRVSPTFLPRDSSLAGVSGVYNSVMISGDPIGSVTFTGEGAGKDATSSAVIADILEIARQIDKPQQNGLGGNGKYKLLPLTESSSKFYVRARFTDNSSLEQLNPKTLIELLKQNDINLINSAKSKGTNTPDSPNNSQTNGTLFHFITDEIQEQKFQTVLDNLSNNYNLQIENVIRGEQE